MAPQHIHTKSDVSVTSPIISPVDDTENDALLRSTSPPLHAVEVGTDGRAGGLGVDLNKHDHKPEANGHAQGSLNGHAPESAHADPPPPYKRHPTPPTERRQSSFAQPRQICHL